MNAVMVMHLLPNGVEGSFITIVVVIPRTYAKRLSACPWCTPKTTADCCMSNFVCQNILNCRKLFVDSNRLECNFLVLAVRALALAK